MFSSGSELIHKLFKGQGKLSARSSVIDLIMIKWTVFQK